MRKQTVFFAVLVGGIMTLWSGSLTRAEEQQTEKTITGEVVDSACFLSYGKRGADHKACAEACLKGGQDMGIYDEETDTLYILLENKPGTDPNRPIKNYVAKMVEVTGTVVQKANANAIIVKDVKSIQ